jgi:L-rhamnose isomerase / sugar isomerase
MPSTERENRMWDALESFRIELPSWGFANTGTRFGKFIQPAAATTTEEKIADAGQVHAFTGCCPSVAVHVLWDFPAGVASVEETMAFARRYGVAIGAINPNVFQDQIYKHGSLGSPEQDARQAALQHMLDCVEIANRTGSRDISLWFADGSNFPGTANIRRRKAWFEEGLQTLHARMQPQQRMLVEYKPFEPAFYHTDIADWGMAYLLAKKAGPQARVLVDTGHHYQAQNIEQIVAWLLAENMLGGFHFNDRRYADDDLTLGSIDPYQVFRIFHEIALFEFETGARADIAYMVDQSHNLKGKIEEMIQTASTAQVAAPPVQLVWKNSPRGRSMRS